jgi:hypothetical protein
MIFIFPEFFLLKFLFFNLSKIFSFFFFYFFFFFIEKKKIIKFFFSLEYLQKLKFSMYFLLKIKKINKKNILKAKKYSQLCKNYFNYQIKFLNF